MTERPEDQTLVAAAAAGDNDAFRTLYRKYVKPVYWIAHGILSLAADAEDVAQETFVVAWRKLPELQLASESLLPWLATICRFQSANRLRAKRKDQMHMADALEEDIADTVSVEDQVITAALAQRIAEEVAVLSPLDQQIFELCAAEGYAYQAAADALGVSHGTVRNRLSRMRTHMRGAVKEVRDA